MMQKKRTKFGSKFAGTKLTEGVTFLFIIYNTYVPIWPIIQTTNIEVNFKNQTADALELHYGEVAHLYLQEK